MPNWKSVNKNNYEEYCFENHFGLAIITGEVSNITCFDFDDMDEYNRIIQDFPILKTYKTIKTKNGVHIYCRYDKNVKTTTNGLINYSSVDIRNDDAILFAPPTKYKMLSGNIFQYEYLGGEILPVPSFSNA